LSSVLFGAMRGGVRTKGSMPQACKPTDMREYTQCTFCPK
jgi:hypothetical protein